ncbi:MAG: hypothetical protein D6732_22485 [Methanobacteriota archaeon]|nr:MAG: hypothetical protein D6732_22485 [Euryarchaeota archaeon]
MAHIHMEIIRGFEHVLTNEKTTSTYKYALLSAIMDYVIENPAELPRNGFHYIPVIYLAKRFLYYYYPTTFPEIIIQWKTRKGARPGTKIQNLIQDHFNQGDPELVISIRDGVDGGETLDSALVKLLVDIRYVILDKPLQYIKATRNEGQPRKFKNYRFKESKFTLFGMLTTTLSMPQDYEHARKAAMTWPEIKEMTYPEMESTEFAYLTIGAYTYRELTKYRFFLRDAIQKYWIDLTEKYAKGNYRQLDRFIYGLRLVEATPTRDNQFIRTFKTKLKEIFGSVACIYCDTPLQSISNIHIDHFIPWSKLPSNKFWNLYPVCKSCNSEKSNQLLELDSTLSEKMRRHLLTWIDFFISDNSYWHVFSGGESKDLLKNQNLDSITEVYIERIKEIMEQFL